MISWVLASIIERQLLQTNPYLVFSKIALASSYYSMSSMSMLLNPCPNPFPSKSDLELGNYIYIYFFGNKHDTNE
jgi:hypothetical protein